MTANWKFVMRMFLKQLSHLWFYAICSRIFFFFHKTKYVQSIPQRECGKFNFCATFDLSNTQTVQSPLELKVNQRCLTNNKVNVSIYRRVLVFISFEEPAFVSAVPCQFNLTGPEGYIEAPPQSSAAFFSTVDCSYTITAYMGYGVEVQVGY